MKVDWIGKSVRRGYSRPVHRSQPVRVDDASGKSALMTRDGAKSVLARSQVSPKRSEMNVDYMGGLRTAGGARRGVWTSIWD